VTMQDTLQGVISNGCRLEGQPLGMGDFSKDFSQTKAVQAEVRDGKLTFHGSKLACPSVNRFIISKGQTTTTTTTIFLDPNNNGCVYITNETACLTSRDGGTGLGNGFPCEWCCGEKCRADADEVCATKAYLNSHSSVGSWNGQSKNGLGESTCALPKTEGEDEEETSFWSVESWISLAFCQALVAIWVCAELLLKRRLRWCIVKCFHIRAALFGTIWQFASFLFVCGIMWISYTFNKEHSPNSWWVPNVVTLVCFYAAYKAIRRFCPETSRRIFALGIIDEETNEGEPPPIESLPDYWTNKKLRQPKNFDQMVYVEEERLAVFDELLNATYKGVCTQDRPCPKTDSPCKKNAWRLCL